MKVLSIIALLMAFAFSGKAQSGVRAVFLEAGGPAGYGSVNVQGRLLQLKQSTFELRIGYGTYRFRGVEGSFHPDVIVPLGVYFRHARFERWSIGAGITGAGIQRFEGNQLKTVWGVSGFETVSFRYLNKTHWKFDVSAYILHEPQKNIRPWAGLGFAYWF